jgi:hypothetical protein
MKITEFKNKIESNDNSSSVNSIPQDAGLLNDCSIKELHPTIRQLFALGYEVGDRVTGRNIDPDQRGKRTDWCAELTEDNLILQYYDFGRREYCGEEYENGLEKLAEDNFEAGIYFNVNAGRDNASVKRCFAVFWESDTVSLAEQAEINSKLPCDLTVAVTTKRSTHSYLRLSEEFCYDLNLWVKLQKLATFAMGSDPAIKDKPRLMRLAGFDHLKVSEFQLPGEFDYDVTPCILKTCNSSVGHPPEQIREAFAVVATELGIQEYSEERFAGYQFIAQKLNQKKKAVNYSHENFNPNIFRTCPDEQVTEFLSRAKVWARLCEQKHTGKDCAKPETAWTQPLEKVRKQYKSEFDIKLLQCTREALSAGGVAEGETLSEYFGRAYGLGFTEAGSPEARQQWHTCQCPHHGSSSGSVDNLHINNTDPNYKKGSVKCQSGCSSEDVLTAFRQKAKDSGDTLWNLSEFGQGTSEGSAESSQEVDKGVTPTVKRNSIVLKDNLKPIPIELFFTKKQQENFSDFYKRDSYKLASAVQGIKKACQDLNLRLTTSTLALWDSIDKEIIDWAVQKDIESKLDDSFFFGVAQRFYLSLDPESASAKILETRLKEIYAAKVKEAQEPLVGWHPKGETYEINTKFVADSVLPRMPKFGNVNVQAATGAGKSTFIRKYVELHASECFLSITPTISIGRIQVEQFGSGFQYWEDVKDCPLNSVSKLVITYDSLHKIEDKFFEECTIILDETDSGVTHLLQSSTVEKNNGRHKALKVFKDALSRCKSVISLDANLTNPIADFIADLAPHLPVVNFTSDVKRKKADYTFYQKENNRELFYDILNEKLEKNQTLLISSDSQIELKTIHKFISETYPTLKVFRFDSETSKTSRGLAFAHNPTAFIAEHCLDICMYSPSLNQGASLEVSRKLIRKEISLQENSKIWENIPAHFDAHLDVSLHLNPFKTRQRLNRERYPIERHVFCGNDIPLTGCKSPFVESQLKNICDHQESLIELYTESRTKMGEDATSADILREMAKIVDRIAAGESPEQNCLAKIRAREADQQTNRAAKIIEQVRAEGHGVAVISGKEQVSTGVVAKTLKEIKYIDRATLAQDIITISTEGVVLEEVQNLDQINYRQKVQVAKSLFELEFPGLLSKLPLPDIFYYNHVLTDNKKWLNGIKTWFNYNNLQFNSDKDVGKISNIVEKFKLTDVITTQDNKCITPMLSFVKSWGLFDIFNPEMSDQEFNIADPAVVKFLKKSDAKTTKGLKQFFNTSPSSLFKCGIKSINRILSVFGWQLKIVRKDNNKKFYRIARIVPSEIVRDIYENYAVLVEGVLKTKNLQTLAVKGTQIFSNGTMLLSTYIYEITVASRKKQATELLKLEKVTGSELNKIFGLIPGMEFSFTDGDENSEAVFEEVVSMLTGILETYQDVYSENRVLRKLAKGVIKAVEGLERAEVLTHLASEIEVLIAKDNLTETTAGLFLSAYNCYSCDLAQYLTEKDYESLRKYSGFHDIERHVGALFSAPRIPSLFVAARDLAKESPTIHEFPSDFQQLTLPLDMALV